MRKQIFVVYALAAILACVPGKVLFGQKIVLITENGEAFTVDMSSQPCKIAPHTSLLINTTPGLIPAIYEPARGVAIFRGSVFAIASYIQERRTSISIIAGTQFNGPGADTKVLAADSSGVLYWIDASNRLVTCGTYTNAKQDIRGTIPFKGTGDMVFYKNRLYLTTEGGVAEIDVNDPSRSKMVLPTPGREFPGLINVSTACNDGNKVYGIEAVGNTTNIVEFDLEQNRILGVYCSFDLGSKVSDAGSPTESGESPAIIVGAIHIKPDCWPGLSGETIKLEAYTPAGDTGISYTYSKGAVTKGPYTGAATLSGQLGPGTWNLRIRRSNGCILDTPIVIVPPINVRAVVETKPDSCDAGTGQAFIRMIEGESPFDFELIGLPRQSFPLFESLHARPYDLWIRDRFSCTATVSFAIDPYRPPMPIKEIQVVPAKICGMGGEIRLIYHPSAGVTGERIDDEDFARGGGLFTNVTAGRRRLYVQVGSCVFDTAVTVPIVEGVAPVFSFSNKRADCHGAGGSSILQISGITPPFTIRFNNGSFTSEQTFLNLAPGIYPVVVADRNGCQWTLSDTILPYIPVPPPVIDSVVSENRCLGVGNIKIGITGAEAPYRFQVDGSLYNSGMRSVDLAAGTYDAVIYNAAKCRVDTVTFTIRGKENCDTIRALFVPSAFTPNGDGKNDILMPHTNPAGKVVRFVFRVYNRNGQVVFESRSPNNGWNGKYKGLQQPAATYVWVFEGTDVDGKPVNYKGTTVLIR